MRTRPPEYPGAARLRVFAAAWPVTSLGPGQRFVVWVAGCGRNCPGCISPEMQLTDAGHDVPVEVLARRAGSVPTRLNGLTISGGEPLDQPEGLAAFLERIRADQPEWSIMVFTGYTLDQVLADPLRRAAVIPGVDVLIDGPFRRALPSPHPLKGSANQRIIALTGRGRALLRQMDPATLPRFNAGLGSPDGVDMIIGIPPAGRQTDAGAIGKVSCDT